MHDIRPGTSHRRPRDTAGPDHPPSSRGGAASSRRRAATGVAALVGLAVVVAGCTGEAGASADGTSASVPASEGVGVRVVSPAAAAALLEQSPAPALIDVRTPDEFAAGHIDGAELVDYSAPDFRERIAGLDPTGSYVIYCRSGNRSAGARAVMTELGFVDVADIDGGIVAWVEDGRPVTS